MKKIVWFASWYPNDADAFTGDFIQRHARATAPFQPVRLVFVGKKADPPQSYINPPEVVPGLTEELLYYNGAAQPGKWAGTGSARRYLKSFLNWFRLYRRQNGLPDLVHVQVAMRAGLPALYLKKRYGIPYVITEHWTGYFRNSAHPVADKSLFYRLVLKTILRNASLIMPVSADLGREMIRLAGPLPVAVVPNVVDTRHFYLKTVSSTVFRFIHVSSMSAVKNPAGILKAFRLLIGTGAAAELVMIGPAGTLDAAGEPGRDNIRFTGEIAYSRVGEELRKANAFILFSERENQPCVILESLCCGVPVIATRTGGITEVIDDSNGILIEPGDEQGLMDAMKKMMENYGNYDPAAISAKSANRFNYETIGKAHAAIYHRLTAE